MKERKVRLNAAGRASSGLRTMVDPQLPAGPREPPVLQTLWWLTEPISFMESCRRRFGENFTVRFLGFKRPTVFLSDPEAIRALYSEPKHGLPPGRTLALRPVLGARSLLLLEGEDHLSRRRLMLPPFHGERMRAYGPLITELTEREVEGWPLHKPFALLARMQALTLEVIITAVFGVVDEERRQRLRQLLPSLLQQRSSLARQLSALISSRGGGGDRLQRIAVLLSMIDEVLYEEIATRREETASRGGETTTRGEEGASEPPAGALGCRQDILSMLIAARGEDGEAMGDEELRDQLITLLLAGHETTATALAWTVDLLLAHPSAERQLRERLGSAEEDDHMRAVTTEALRLRPVVPLAGRRLAAELKLDGLTLPPGTDVTPAIWLAHTQEDVYPQPYAFRPERFLDGAPRSFAWVPFGGGVRRCLGAAFAEFEMKIVLSTIFRMCSLAAAQKGGERIARRAVTLAPANGTVIQVMRWCDPGA